MLGYIAHSAVLQRKAATLNFRFHIVVYTVLRYQVIKLFENYTKNNNHLKSLFDYYFWNNVWLRKMTF
jgi:hypothetical protein